MAAAAPPATATTIAMAIAVAVVPSLVVIWIHDDEINTLYDGGLGVIPTILCCCRYLPSKPRSVAHTTHNSHTKIDPIKDIAPTMAAAPQAIYGLTTFP